MLHFESTEYDRYVYQNELKDFLPQKFIDFHVHINKEEIERLDNCKKSSSWVRHVYSEMQAEDLLELYRKLFPENEVTPLAFGSCSQNIPAINTYVQDCAAKYHFPILLRTSFDMSASDIEQQVIDGGFIGLKPYLTCCPPYIPAKEIRIFDFLPHAHLEIANKHGWIIMLHIPRDLRFKDPVNLAQLLEIEEKYPNVKLIVAHIGRAYAKEDIGDAFEVLGKTKNMLFDFTANMCDDAIEACIRTFGAKRLLFGSDLPVAIMRMYRIVENGIYYNVVPRGLYGDVSNLAHMRETDEPNVTIMIYEQLLALKRVAEKLQLSKDEINDILYGNAQRLIESFQN